jgi:hypothetical protein
MLIVVIMNALIYINHVARDCQQSYSYASESSSRLCTTYLFTWIILFLDIMLASLIGLILLLDEYGSQGTRLWARSASTSALPDQPNVAYPICYIKNVNVVKTALGDRPCGPTNSTNPYVPCCVEGDTCLENGICYAPNDFAGTAGMS